MVQFHQFWYVLKLGYWQGFFLRYVVLGGEIAFVGRENVKNNQKKTNEIICYCLGEKFKTWGGKFPPLKSPEKNTGYW